MLNRPEAVSETHKQESYEARKIRHRLLDRDPTGFGARLLLSKEIKIMHLRIEKVT